MLGALWSKIGGWGAPPRVKGGTPAGKGGIPMWGAPPRVKGAPLWVGASLAGRVKGGGGTCAGKGVSADQVATDSFVGSELIPYVS